MTHRCCECGSDNCSCPATAEEIIGNKEKQRKYNIDHWLNEATEEQHGMSLSFKSCIDDPTRQVV